MGRLHRLRYLVLGELGTTSLFSSIHRVIYRLSAGRILGRVFGCRVILLTTTGRKSRQPRSTPIFGFQEGKAIIVIPSNAGKEHYPSWYLNLGVDPRAQVQLGSEIRQVRAREASPKEKEYFWPRLVSQYHGYQVYRERTDRRIQLIILEPA